MALGTETGEAAIAAGKIDADRHRPAFKIGVIKIHETVARMQGREGGAIEFRRAAAETDLPEARTAPHENGKRARAYFDIKRTFIALWKDIEGRNAVADHARENIEPARGAFRVGRGREIRGQLQPLFQFDDIDATGFQDRAAVG